MRKEVLGGAAFFPHSQLARERNCGLQPYIGSKKAGYPGALRRTARLTNALGLRATRGSTSASWDMKVSTSTNRRRERASRPRPQAETPRPSSPLR